MTVVWPGVSAAHKPKTATSHSADVRILLLGRSIVAQSPEGPQRRQPAWLHQLDLDPPVFAIPFQVLWRVADNVLVAQFDADLLRDIGEFVEVLHREVPSACLFRDFAQQAGARQLLRGPAASGRRLENADGVDLDVRFAHQVLNFRFGVAAVVVAAVGDDQQGLAGILGLLHLMQAQVHGVQQRRSEEHTSELQSVLNLFQAGSEFDYQIGAVVKLHQEKLVFGIGRWVLSSKRRKFSFSSPVTNRLSGSVTVTGINTSVVSTRMLAFGRISVGTGGLGRGTMETCGPAPGFSSALPSAFP